MRSCLVLLFFTLAQDGFDNLGGADLAVHADVHADVLAFFKDLRGDEFLGDNGRWCACIEESRERYSRVNRADNEVAFFWGWLLLALRVLMRRRNVEFVKLYIVD